MIKPILFNIEMVRAIQNGTKTVTRRCIKFPTDRDGKFPNSDDIIPFKTVIDDEKADFKILPFFHLAIKVPYCKGDILYVRETWCKGSLNYGEERYFYKADGKIPHCKWRPSIHMPKEAARIFLRVTKVRIERLQDMTLNDFLAEGIVLRPEAFNDPENAYGQARNEYSMVWNSTVKKSELDKYGWDANPWVWVIEFERIRNGGEKNDLC